MTIGVGGSTPEIELGRLTDMSEGVSPVPRQAYGERISKAQALMRESGFRAIYINAGTNLYYFTGTRWNPSERLAGVVIPAEGEVVYIAPEFERETLKDYRVVEGEVVCWEEHEDPYALISPIVGNKAGQPLMVGIDESLPFFHFDGMRKSNPDLTFVSGEWVTRGCRILKSDLEIALIKRGMEMTLAVQKAAARILKPGITTSEVASFINKAHKVVGADDGSSFCIVLFGEASAYPHGVKDPQVLKENDVVLIDTGCLFHGYNSDITRTYVFGKPNRRQREVWNLEKAAQAAAFKAAEPGIPCSLVETAAREVVESGGFGPGYRLPGLPHRTGHGIGLDVHEWPYLVLSDETPLERGMCMSNEPMISIPGEFGIRLEDHFYMTEEGSEWFTEPAFSIDDPFGYEAG